MFLPYADTRPPDNSNGETLSFEYVSLTDFRIAIKSARVRHPQSNMRANKNCRNRNCFCSNVVDGLNLLVLSLCGNCFCQKPSSFSLKSRNSLPNCNLIWVDSISLILDGKELIVISGIS